MAESKDPNGLLKKSDEFLKNGLVMVVLANSKATLEAYLNGLDRDLANELSITASKPRERGQQGCRAFLTATSKDIVEKVLQIGPKSTAWSGSGLVTVNKVDINHPKLRLPYNDAFETNHPVLSCREQSTGSTMDAATWRELTEVLRELKDTQWKNEKVPEMIKHWKDTSVALTAAIAVADNARATGDLTALSNHADLIRQWERTFTWLTARSVSGFLEKRQARLEKQVQKARVALEATTANPATEDMDVD